MTARESPERLADVAQVVITDAAAADYARARGLRLAEARRELLEVACEATRRGADGELEQWRARTRTGGIDLAVRVLRQDSRHGRPLAVIVSADARPYR